MTSQKQNITRRSTLQGIGAGIGVATLGTGLVGAQGGPCFKEFSCDEDATYVKIEFIEVYEENEDGDKVLVDCYFEEETDTGLVEVTDWESKEGEECEPVSVELEYAEGWFATNLLAYGGGSCEEVINPGDNYNSNLEADVGQRAAISNLQFCVAQPEEIIGNIALAYEDLPKDASDWDVNDWQVDLKGTFLSVESNGDGSEEVTRLIFDIIPQARGAADDHEWHMEFLEGTVGGCPFDFELVTKDGAGTVLTTTTGSYDGTGDEDITVWSSTRDALPDLQNTGGACIKPDEWATLTVTFTEQPCTLDVPTDPQDLGMHVTDLFFNPYLYNKNKDLTVNQGDVRLVAVPDEFQWPLEREPIWEVYDEVSEDTSAGYSQPSYDTSTWYNDGLDSSLATNCNFEPADLGGE